MEAVHIKVGVIGFILGTVLGSFVKVLADRSLVNKSFRGRSYCPECKHNLHWYDLFPIFSYIFLRGRCRYCRKKIGIEYLLVEVVMGILIGFLFWQSFAKIHLTLDNGQWIIFLLDLLFKTFFITVLVALFITDLKKMFIPDRISLPAIWISITFITVIIIIKIIYLYYYLSQNEIGRFLLPPHSDYFQRHALMAAQPLLGSVVMGIVIGGFFTLLIIITRGKGMGGGDVKLGALIGLALGFPASLVALMISFLSGALFSLLLIFTGKKHFGQSIPFGPFLVLGSLVALFWGQQITDWYLKLGS